MLYTVTRNGQTYGPYTLEDLQRYVASGNVLLTDLAKSEEMPEWLPVSQVLGVAAEPAAAIPPTAYPAAYVAPVVSPYPDPPNLAWGLLLLFSILTCGIFGFIYELIQTLWVRQVQPSTKALIYFIIFYGLEFINLLTQSHRRFANDYSSGFHVTHYNVGHSLLSIAIFVLFILYRFTMRNDIERHYNTVEPMGLRLSGVMTFFFGGYYFQYHFNRINDIKRTMAYRGGAL